MVTIEPIMEFDHTALVEMLKKIKPFQVNIGCNTSKDIKLPEASRIIIYLEDNGYIDDQKNITPEYREAVANGTVAPLQTHPAWHNF